jgi:lipoate synthase
MGSTLPVSRKNLISLAEIVYNFNQDLISTGSTVIVKGQMCSRACPLIRISRVHHSRTMKGGSLHTVNSQHKMSLCILVITVHSF